MDAEAFMRLVVPKDGIKYLAISTQGGRPRHYGHTSFEAMSEAAVQFNTQRKDVYFALAAFKPPVQETDRAGNLVFYPDGQPKILKRTASLAHTVKAFWADLDVGDGKPYATQDQAVEDMRRFVEDSEIPPPVLVNSGGGVHAYWPLDAEIPAAAWQGCAKLWRMVLNYYCVGSDPARDMDVASILRVPGTNNHKLATPRPVLVIQEATATPARDFIGWLNRNAQKAKPTAKPTARPSLGAVPEWLKTDDADNADLTGHSGAPKASAVEASKHCNQLRVISAVRGNVDEPVWRAMLGVVKHSAEGGALAHEWSQGHPEYDEAQTQDKLDRWTAGPSTCAHFDNINPSACDGCPHKGKVTSPIQLGVTFVEKQIIQVQVHADEGEQVQEVTLPPGYIWDAGRSLLCRQIRGDDGVIDNVPFSHTLLYAVTRIRQLDTTYEIRLRSHHERGTREFTLPTAEVAVIGDALIKALGSREVFLYGRNDKAKNLMRGFLIDEVKRCERAGQEVVMFDQFGWHDEGTAFLLGNTLYRKNPAETTEIIPSAGLKSHTEIGVAPDASAELWSRAVARVYGAQGAEPLQYAIASSFGSALTDLFGDDYHGAAVCLSGQKTGQGKTTTCWTGLSVWGRPSQMMYSNREGSTFNARIARHGRYKNIPVLHDELSQFSPDEAMQLLYAMANGRGRARLDQTGENEREPRRWKMSGYVTTNRPINELITLAKGGLLATVVRNFEINLDDYEVPMVDLRVMDEARSAIDANSGAAGAIFAQYIVTNREAIKQVIVTLSNKILLKLPKLGSDTRFRLYRMHLEATLTGAFLAKRLGLLPFDVQALMTWAVAHTAKLCAFAEEAEEEQSASPIERMFSDLLPGTIVTEDFRDGRSKTGPERLQFPLRDVPVARFVHGCPTMEKADRWAAGKFMVTVNAVRGWAAENRMTKAQLLQRAMEAGYYNGESASMKIITRGTALPGGQARCYVFDLSNAEIIKKLSPKKEEEDGDVSATADAE